MSLPNPLEEVATELAKRQGSNVIFGVGVDGSNMSDKAMDVATTLTNVRRGDKFYVLHVSDRTKEYLPKHLQPTHLKNLYADRAAGCHVKADWMCREKEEGLSTCECLTRMADKCKIDVLTIGSWGRKGEKLDMLGSVSDFSLRKAHCSVCIVRSTGVHSTTSAIKYLFATDGSHAAHLAFCFLVNYLMRPSDSMHVVMVTTKDGTEEAKVVDKYRQYMKAHNVPGECSVKCVDMLKERIPSGIIDAVTENGCGVLVIGISGYGKKKLGSVSEEVSTSAPCTTIIIKDHREVMTGSSGALGPVGHSP